MPGPPPPPACLVLESPETLRTHSMHVRSNRAKPCRPTVQLRPWSYWVNRLVLHDPLGHTVLVLPTSDQRSIDFHATTRMANSTGDRLGAGPHARPVPEQGALGHRRGMFSTLSLYVDRILHVSMPLETWEMYRRGGAGPCAYLHTWKLHVFPVNGILPQRNLSKPSAKLQPTSSFSNKRDVDVNPRKYTAKHLQGIM